jgi:hypothetical protein
MEQRKIEQKVAATAVRWRKIGLNMSRNVKRGASKLTDFLVVVFSIAFFAFLIAIKFFYVLQKPNL